MKNNYNLFQIVIFFRIWKNENLDSQLSVYRCIHTVKKHCEKRFFC